MSGNRFNERTGLEVPAIYIHSWSKGYQSTANSANIDGNLDFLYSLSLDISEEVITILGCT